VGLHVEYAERGTDNGILLKCSLFCEYSNLECVHIHGIYRVDQAEYVIRIRAAASQEYVNTYSTRRCVGRQGLYIYSQTVNNHEHTSTHAQRTDARVPLGGV